MCELETAAQPYFDDLSAEEDGSDGYLSSCSYEDGVAITKPQKGFLDGGARRKHVVEFDLLPAQPASAHKFHSQLLPPPPQSQEFDSQESAVSTQQSPWKYLNWRPTYYTSRSAYNRAIGAHLQRAAVEAKLSAMESNSLKHPDEAWSRADHNRAVGCWLHEASTLVKLESCLPCDSLAEDLSQIRFYPPDFECEFDMNDSEAEEECLSEIECEYL
eukprot:CAMPEP_0181294832 /NCGR_PEP_ID=MMETSP1101-20121128/3817_1 /TAXON_ID=46948 /ORGANISM="Rhodomonas abbreviata, Strain Caron Lab Isolate" /LENGTH=215 /DNA_ID=CAMNT_0023399529 /DNA_START=152 /DNA_END=799 /DNA_ORIENTATION=+